jgi:hypothetical protein
MRPQEPSREETIESRNIEVIEDNLKLRLFMYQKDLRLHVGHVLREHGFYKVILRRLQSLTNKITPVAYSREHLSRRVMYLLRWKDAKKFESAR